MTQQPRNAILDDVKMEQPASSLDANQLVLDLTPDNSISGGVAKGDVRFRRGSTTARSPVMQFKTGNRGDLESASMTGGVTLAGERGESGSAGRVNIAFSDSGKIAKMKVIDNVKLTQQGTGPKASRTTSPPTLSISPSTAKDTCSAPSRRALAPSPSPSLAPQP